MTKDDFLGSLDIIAKWSIYILILVLPFSKSLIEASIAVGLVCVLARKMIAKEKPITRFSLADAALWVFIAACLLSIINSGFISLSIRAIFTKTLKFAALFFITKEIINTEEKLRDFIVMAAIASFIALMNGLMQHFFTHEDLLRGYPSFLYDAYRPFILGVPTSSFPYPNDFAAWILMVLFPAMSFVILARSGWRSKAMALAISALALHSLFLTHVRGAWLAGVASFGIFMIAKFKKAGAVVLVVALAVLVINRGVSEKFLRFASFKDRVVMWTNSTKLFVRHPVIGNGLNTFYVNYAKVREDEYRDKKGSYAHNCYLQMAVETGLVGLAAFLFFVFSVLFKSLKYMVFRKGGEYDWLVAGLTAGLVAFLVHSAVDTNLYSLPLAALFWLGMGMLVSVMRIQGGRDCPANSL